jgi:hypothetical protein
MIIKNSMQKSIIVKKKKHTVDKTFAQRRLETADELEKDEKTYEKESRVDI